MRARKVSGGAACRVRDGDIQLVMKIERSWLSTIAKCTPFNPNLSELQFSLNVTSGDVTGVFSIDRQNWPATHLAGKKEEYRKTSSIRLEKVVKGGVNIDLGPTPTDEQEPEPWIISETVFGQSHVDGSDTDIKVSPIKKAMQKSRAKKAGSGQEGTHERPITFSSEDESMPSDSEAATPIKNIHRARPKAVESGSDSDVRNTPLAKRMKLTSSVKAKTTSYSALGERTGPLWSMDAVTKVEVDITKTSMQKVRVTVPVGTSMVQLPRAAMGSFGRHRAEDPERVVSLRQQPVQPLALATMVDVTTSTVPTLSSSRGTQTESTAAVKLPTPVKSNMTKTTSTTSQPAKAVRTNHQLPLKPITKAPETNMTSSTPVASAVQGHKVMTTVITKPSGPQAIASCEIVKASGQMATPSVGMTTEAISALPCGSQAQAPVSTQGQMEKRPQRSAAIPLTEPSPDSAKTVSEVSKIKKGENTTENQLDLANTNGGPSQTDEQTGDSPLSTLNIRRVFPFGCTITSYGERLDYRGKAWCADKQELPRYREAVLADACEQCRQAKRSCKVYVEKLGTCDVNPLILRCLGCLKLRTCSFLPPASKQVTFVEVDFDMKPTISSSTSTTELDTPAASPVRAIATASKSTPPAPWKEVPGTTIPPIYPSSTSISTITHIPSTCATDSRASSAISKSGTTDDKAALQSNPQSYTTASPAERTRQRIANILSAGPTHAGAAMNSIKDVAEDPKPPATASTSMTGSLSIAQTAKAQPPPNTIKSAIPVPTASVEVPVFGGAANHLPIVIGGPQGSLGLGDTRTTATASVGQVSGPLRTDTGLTAHVASEALLSREQELKNHILAQRVQKQTGPSSFASATTPCAPATGLSIRGSASSSSIPTTPISASVPAPSQSVDK